MTLKKSALAKVCLGAIQNKWHHSAPKCIMCVTAAQLCWPQANCTQGVTVWKLCIRDNNLQYISKYM